MTRSDMNYLLYNEFVILQYHGSTSGADPGFHVRGAHLKKLRRAEGGAKIVGVFRVKNHDFTPKKSVRAPLNAPLHITCVKNTDRDYTCIVS